MPVCPGHHPTACAISDTLQSSSGLLYVPLVATAIDHMKHFPSWGTLTTNHLRRGYTYKYKCVSMAGSRLHPLSGGEGVVAESRLHPLNGGEGVVAEWRLHSLSGGETRCWTIADCVSQALPRWDSLRDAIGCPTGMGHVPLLWGSDTARNLPTNMSHLCGASDNSSETAEQHVPPLLGLRQRPGRCRPICPTSVGHATTSRKLQSNMSYLRMP